MKKISHHIVGGIPLLESIVKKINLRAILDEFIPQKNREEISPADVLILLIYNLTIEKIPLYELEKWVGSLDLNCMAMGSEIMDKNIRFTDDRFGDVIDRFFEVDRASLMTRIVIEAVKSFDLDLEQVNNDSTSVKAFGNYPGKTKTGLELKRGNSKDHRHDLKQLIYSLSISSDGGIPIHFKTYPGNTNDDSTHIDTWNTLCKIIQTPNFLYVADCKLCSDLQLSYIAENKGKALAPIPEYWKEVVEFKNELRTSNKPKKEIWRRRLPGATKTTYYSVYEGKYRTHMRGYKIHWIHSSERQKDDYKQRKENLKKAITELNELIPKLNKRKWRSEEAIAKECERILTHRKVKKFINLSVDHKIEYCKRKVGRGRPNKNTTYEESERKIFNISWHINETALKNEKNVDGVYPLLSTDIKMSSKEAIMAYKYQPKLEKRFMQLKSIHKIAPLLFKKLERVEATMFLFFIGLLVQALIEREIRYRMEDQKIVALEIYPENRESIRPTTSKIIDLFNGVSTYTMTEENTINKHVQDLSEAQKLILQLMSIEELDYWNAQKII